MRLRLVVALISLTATTRAWAANEDGVPLSPDAIIAGTTIASHDGATGAWYNPAALGGLSRSSVQASASIYTLSFRSIDGLVSTRLPWQDRHDKLESTDFTTIPSCLAFAFRIGERIGLSLGLFSPIHEYFTLSSAWNSTSPIQPDGTRTRYDQSLAYTVRVDSTQLGLGLGVKVIDTLRVGIGVFGSQNTTEEVFDLSYSARSPETAAQPGGFVGLSTRSLGNRFGLRGTAGAQWEAAPWLTFALAIRSPTLGLAATGKTTTTVFGGSPTTGTFAQETVDEQTVLLSGPARAYLAAELRFGGVRLAIEGDARHPLSDAHLGADKWVGNARVGLIAQTSQNVWVGLGAFTDMGGSDLQKSGSSIDFFGGTMGVQFRSPHVIRLRGGTDAWDLRTTLALHYGVGVGSINGLLIDPLKSTASQPQTATPLYHELSLNVGTALEF